MNNTEILRISRAARFQSYIGRLVLHRIGRKLVIRGMPRMAILAHDTIGNDILLTGRYEADLLSAITERILPRALPDHHRLVALDIGANIGNHALAFASVFSRVLAFEPNPAAIHLLRANVLLNRAPNILICPVGLGEFDQSCAFRTEMGNLGASHFVSPTERHPSELLSLEIVNGDTYINGCLAQTERVGLVKIDVEGFEEAVVAGLSVILRRDSPLVFFEALDGAAAERTASALRLNGYRYFLSIEPRRVAAKPELLRAAMRWIVGSHLHMQTVTSFEDRSYGLILACTSDAWL